MSALTPITIGQRTLRDVPVGVTSGRRLPATASLPPLVDTGAPRAAPGHAVRGRTTGVSCTVAGGVVVLCGAAYAARGVPIARKRADSGSARRTGWCEAPARVAAANRRASRAQGLHGRAASAVRLCRVLWLF